MPSTPPSALPRPAFGKYFACGGRHFAFGMGAAQTLWAKALRRADARTGAQPPCFCPPTQHCALKCESILGGDPPTPPCFCPPTRPFGRALAHRRAEGRNTLAVGKQRGGHSAGSAGELPLAAAGQTGKTLKEGKTLNEGGWWVFCRRVGRRRRLRPRRWVRACAPRRPPTLHPWSRPGGCRAALSRIRGFRRGRGRFPLG